MKRNDPDRNIAAFTLAELLIVVAIIAVLVAIAIPVFASQLEKSREAVDIANVRAAYAEVMTAAISDDAGAGYGGQTMKQADGTYRAVVSPLAQHRDGWTTNVEGMSIGGVPSDKWIGEPKKNGSCTVSYDPGNDSVTIDWNGGTSGGSGGNTPAPGTTVDLDPGNAYQTALNECLYNTPVNTSVSIEVENGVVKGISTTLGNGGGSGAATVSNEQVRQTLIDAGVIDADGKILKSAEGLSNSGTYTISVVKDNNNNSPNDKPRLKTTVTYN